MNIYAYIYGYIYPDIASNVIYHLLHVIYCATRRLYNIDYAIYIYWTRLQSMDYIPGNAYGLLLLATVVSIFDL